MTTVVLNLLIASGGLALLSAPVLLAATFRALSVHHVLAGLMGSMAAVSLVGYCIVSLWGTGLLPLLVVGVLLSGVLALAAARAVVLRLWRRKALWPPSGLVYLVIGLVTGLFLVLPGLMALNALDTRFGLVSNYNTDPITYAQCTLAMSSATPADAAATLPVVQSCHPAVVSLINLLSSMTGLSALSATTPALILISALIPVALCSLAKSVWPAVSQRALLATGVVATVSPLIAYHVANGFIAALLAISTAAAVLSGSFLVAARNHRVGVLLIILGGITGMYAYLEFLGPVTVAAPVVTLVTLMIGGSRGIRKTLRNTMPALLASGAVYLATLPLLMGALSIFRERLSDKGFGAAGWPMGPVDVVKVMFWPPGLHETMYTEQTHLTGGFVLGWALFVAIIVATCMAAKKQVNDFDSRVVSIVAIGITALALIGASWMFGTTAYQTWRIETLALPLLLSIVLPATTALRGMLGSWGRLVLPLALGGSLLIPSLAWLPTSTYSVANETTVPATPDALFKSADIVAGMDIGTINVHLPSFFQGLSAETYMHDLTVAVVRNGDPNTVAFADTCTLTTRSMLTDVQAEVTRLAGDYVLIPYPAPCSKTTAPGKRISPFAELFGPAAYGGIRISWTTVAQQPTSAGGSSVRWLGQGAGGVLVNSASSPERIRLLADVTVKNPSATLTFTFNGTAYPFQAAGGKARIDLTLDAPPGSTEFGLRTDSAPIEPGRFFRLQPADFRILPPPSGSSA
ncbi:hypothetical protein [Catellatospora paridis]|uniref:hypothetical protein n=1 Tax=Catellatospora paridis TaxID=1617086 RepID=UPI0012D41D05|nr:hypothetical protein [Catellatospora paridis]